MSNVVKFPYAVSRRAFAELPRNSKNGRPRKPRDPLEASSEALWAKVPELVRRDVEQHLLAQLPADLLAKWRDQHAHGVRIGSDDPFFQFGAGMAVRNLCREQLTDGELEAYGFMLNWDNCYCGVLAAIAASPVRRS